MTNELNPITIKFEPTQDIKDFYELVLSMMEVDADTAANAINPQRCQYIADNLYIIVPVFDCPSALRYSNDLVNVPNGGATITHAMNFDMEHLFFTSPEER